MKRQRTDVDIKGDGSSLAAQVVVRCTESPTSELGAFSSDGSGGVGGLAKTTDLFV